MSVPMDEINDTNLLRAYASTNEGPITSREAFKAFYDNQFKDDRESDDFFSYKDKDFILNLESGDVFKIIKKPYSEIPEFLEFIGSNALTIELSKQHKRHKEVLQSKQKIKELGPFKLVERTAKRDAYRRALEVLEFHNEEYTKEFLRMKIESHSDFVDSQAIYWDYADQTFKVGSTK
jgi:hypothetical protein